MRRQYFLSKHLLQKSWWSDIVMFGLVPTVAADKPALGRAPQPATPTSAHHGVPHLLGCLHRDPSPNREDGTAWAVAHLGLQPVARSVLPFARRDLTDAEPSLSTSRPAGSSATPRTGAARPENPTTRRPRHPNRDFGARQPSQPATGALPTRPDPRNPHPRPGSLVLGLV